MNVPISPIIPTIEQLYATHFNRILLLIVRTVHSRQEAEDLTQETFVKAWRAIPTLKHGENLSGWLSRIASNTVRDARKGNRFTCLSLDDQFIEGHLVADPQEDYEARETVTQAMSRLIPSHQRIIQARLRGYNHQDIIAITGLPPRAVYSMVRHASASFERNYRKVVQG